MKLAKFSYLSDSNEPRSIGNHFRNKRFLHFTTLIEQMPKPLTILDVGGEESYWVNRGYHRSKKIKIVLLNLKEKQVNHPDVFSSVAGDATNLIEYEDNSFNVVFSNSVIEHLYSVENQQKMAKECMRVGKFFYVQTPNKYFPIEPHFMLPFFQSLPASLKVFILTRTKLSRGKYWDKKFAIDYVGEIRLLSLKEFRTLFPESKIYVEYFLGLKKSFTAYNL